MRDWRPARIRVSTCWFTALTIWIWFFAVIAVRAQEAQPANPGGAAPAPPASPAPANAPADNKAGAAAAATDTTEVKPAEQKSYLAWMIESSGPVGAILFVMSFITLALTIKLIVELRHKSMIPPDLVTSFEALLKEDRYQEAFDMAHASDSFLGKVLAAGLMRVAYGYPDALEAMQEVGDDENMRIEHRLSWLAILGTAAPLLGLLGTVEGIIASFRVIATSDTQPKPSLLAEGISTSLFNTFEGLFVAIMATVAFMLLKNQAARLALEVGIASSNLMSRFKPQVSAPPGTGGATGTAAPRG